MWANQNAHRDAEDSDGPICPCCCFFPLSSLHLSFFSVTSEVSLGNDCSQIPLTVCWLVIIIATMPASALWSWRPCTPPLSKIHPAPHGSHHPPQTTPSSSLPFPSPSLGRLLGSLTRLSWRSFAIYTPLLWDSTWFTVRLMASAGFSPASGWPMAQSVSAFTRI